MTDIHTYKNYYFIGIGGIGMSALARYFKFSNSNVYGYDKTSTKLTHSLENENIPILYEDSISLLPKDISAGNTLIIYTPAIPKDLKIKNYFMQIYLRLLFSAAFQQIIILILFIMELKFLLLKQTNSIDLFLPYHPIWRL